jgi:DNA polymerase IIIc chi subunit
MQNNIFHNKTLRLQGCKITLLTVTVSQARKTSIQGIYQDQTKNLRKTIIQNLHPEFLPHFWKQQEDPVARVNIILIQASVH